MKRTLLIALAALGLSGPASAQDDVTVILGNLPNTVTVLADGLANVSDTFNTTQSFEATHSALHDEIQTSVVALAVGTTLEPLSVPLTYRLLEPGRTVGQIAMRLADDPSAETFQANVLGGDDLNTVIARNLAETPDRLHQGWSECGFGICIQFDGMRQYAAEPLLNDGSLLPLVDKLVKGNSTSTPYHVILGKGLLRDTPLGSYNIGNQIANISFLASTVLYQSGIRELYESIHNEALQPLLADTLVPAANQSMLGQPTLTEVATDLEFGPTLEFFNYEGVVGMAGFEAP